MMNTETCPEKERTDTNKLTSVVKLYARGKLGLLFYGEEKYHQAAEECFKSALDIRVTFDDKKFLKKMRELNAPEKTIKEYLNTRSLTEDVWLSSQTII
jgi:hypothetical protein